MFSTIISVPVYMLIIPPIETSAVVTNYEAEIYMYALQIRTAR